MRRSVVFLAAFGLLVAACASDPTASDEYQELERQLVESRQQVAELTAERDALAATIRASSVETQGVSETSRDRFSFAEDDLCEWVSDDELTSFVQEAYAAVGIDWTGVVRTVEPRDSAWDLPGEGYCQWESTGGTRVVARRLSPTQFDEPDAYSELGDGEGVALRTVYGHPGVDEGVIAGGAAFGRYGFWIDGSDEALGLELGAEGVEESIDWNEAEEMLFHIANRFLGAMGWTSR